MFGSIKGNATMDAQDFSKDFLTAFNAHIISYNINVDNGHGPTFHLNGSISSHLHISVTTIRIRCRLVEYPAGYPLEHFGFSDSAEHKLFEVRNNSSVSPIGDIIHEVELTYKTTDFNKFVQDIKKLAWVRYSDKFHKQLDDILD